MVLVRSRRYEGRFVFFFKQKTAYEVHISDWSSDVCSSDLCDAARVAQSVGPLNAGICDRAEQNTPSHVAEAGVAQARATNADVAVAYGGGSTVGSIGRE